MHPNVPDPVYHFISNQVNYEMNCKIKHQPREIPKIMTDDENFDENFIKMLSLTAREIILHNN